MIHYPRKMRKRGRLLLLVIWCIALAATAARGQEPKKKTPQPAVDLPAPNLKVRFHEDFRGGDPKNPNLRFIRDDNIRWEAQGARVTMPAGQGKIATTGIAANFKVRGDFQITASYEILKAEQPTEGYGVGVSIYVAIDPDAGDAVSLARRVGLKGGINFLSDRMRPNPAKGGMDHYVRTKPAKAPTGKLRVERVGTMVRFLFADGDSPDFVPIFQDNKKRIETEFGASEIRYFQFGGDAGQSEAALDLRLLDLTVEAEELPGIIETQKRAAPAALPAFNPPNANAQSASPRLWFTIIGVGGAAVVVLLALGLGAWFWLRRRARAIAPETVEDATPEPIAATISFACPHCSKRLKAKTESAGKKLRCPHCLAVAAVPAADAFEANRDRS